MGTEGQRDADLDTDGHARGTKVEFVLDLSSLPAGPSTRLKIKGFQGSTPGGPI